MTPSALVPRAVAGAARWVMRFAPAAQQRMWCYDAEETLMEVCRDARATRGWWGLAHTAFADIADIARASVVLVLVLLLTFAAMTS